MLGHLLASALSFGLVLGLYNVSDELLFKIDWGPARSNLIKSEVDLPVQIKTSVGENYECIIPARALGEQKASGEDPFPLNESALLKQLFTANPCSTRIEFYWSYELCHNKHIRQYHEELLPDKSSKMQEYFLGYAENNIPSGSGSGKPPEIALGEFMYPYFPVNYTSGTICDLTKQHRMSTVLYICFEEILGQIIEVAEVESCRYEVVFATKSLCSNPIYKRRSAHINRISCHPRDDSPVKPLALTELEVQHREMTSRGLSNLAALFDDVNLKNIKIEAHRKDNMVLYRIRTVDPEQQHDLHENTLKEKEDDEVLEDETDISSNLPDGSSSFKKTSGEAPEKPSAVKLPDTESVRSANREQFLEFIHGRFCLTDHTGGWWFHEVCFSKNVTQFHLNERGKRVQTILIGRWNEEKHTEWVDKQKDHMSSVASNPKEVSLFYGDGDYCEAVNDNRSVIVKIRCQPTFKGIHISFSETSTCRYSVLIENAAFCEMDNSEIFS